MKKLFLTVAACAAMTFSASAVEAGNANIYASGLKVNGNNLQFVLNAPGDVTINFYNGGVKVEGASIEKKGLSAGENTVSLDGVFKDIAANTELTWEVVATAAANTEVVKFSDATQSAQQFIASGIVVENRVESSNFGHIYVSNSIPGNGKIDGIYEFNADLTVVNTDGYTGGIAWANPNTTSVASPHRITLDEEDNLFICDWSDSHSGVWIMDTKNPSANFKPVFGGTRNTTNGLTSENGVNIHGSISSIAVAGKGAERTLYTYDEDYKVDGNVSVLNSYKIGTLANPWIVSPTTTRVNGTDGINHNAGQKSYMQTDSKGGLWVSQYRGAAADTHPALVHFDAKGKHDLTVPLWDGLNNFSFALNYNETKIAIASSKKIYVYNITWDNIPTLSEEAICTITEAAGSNPYGLAFDVADNVYRVASDALYLEAYALPKADNTYITPANEAIIVNDTMTSIADVAVDANAPVEYYNLQGVKVENPANGIFVKKQAGKATKVIL